MWSDSERSERSDHVLILVTAKRPRAFFRQCIWSRLLRQTEAEWRPDHCATRMFTASICINLHINLQFSDSRLPARVTSSFSVDSPLSWSVTRSLFHSRLKTHLFHQSFPPYTLYLPQDCLRGLLPGPFLLSKSVLFLVLFLIFSVFLFDAAD